eukprot:1246293-Amorphochlora_amoeboformis.AAC.1
MKLAGGVWMLERGGSEQKLKGGKFNGPSFPSQHPTHRKQETFHKGTPIAPSPAGKKSELKPLILNGFSSW